MKNVTVYINGGRFLIRQKNSHFAWAHVSLVAWKNFISSRSSATRNSIIFRRKLFAPDALFLSLITSHVRGMAYNGTSAQ